MRARGIYTLCFVWVLVLTLVMSGCQSSVDVDESVREKQADPVQEEQEEVIPEGLVELDISPLYKEGDGSLIRGCLWLNENTLILANKKDQSREGQTDISLYDIAKQQATLLPCDYPFGLHWDWNRHIIIRNEKVAGFGEGSAVTFDLDDPAKINIILKEDDYKRVFSPDLSYLAEVGDFAPESALQGNAVLLLHNLKTGEVIELDRSVIDGGVTATNCYWSFDGATLAYLIDYGRILIYDVASGKSKRITLKELKGSRDIPIHEFFNLAFTPSGKLLITALHDDGYARAVLEDDYESMEWTVDKNRPSMFIIGESGGKVFAEGTTSFKDYVCVVSYDESPRKTVLFRKDGEYFSAGALSPDGKRLAVVTHEGGVSNVQHLYIWPAE